MLTPVFRMITVISSDVQIVSISKVVHSSRISAIPEMFEPQCDKTNKLTCAPSEVSDQPGHLPSLISVFAVCSMGS